MTSLPRKLGDPVAEVLHAAGVDVHALREIQRTAVYVQLPPMNPPGWVCLRHEGHDADYRNPSGLFAIVSACVELDGKRWIHFSMSHRKRLPEWEEMVEAKEAFFGPESTAYQVFAPRSKWVNIHPRCLHLWVCLDGPVTPDFTRGMKTI